MQDPETVLSISHPSTISRSYGAGRAHRAAEFLNVKQSSHNHFTLRAQRAQASSRTLLRERAGERKSETVLDIKMKTGIIGTAICSHGAQPKKDLSLSALSNTLTTGFFHPGYIYGHC